MKNKRYIVTKYLLCKIRFLNISICISGWQCGLQFFCWLSYLFLHKEVEKVSGFHRKYHISCKVRIESLYAKYFIFTNIRLDIIDQISVFNRSERVQGRFTRNRMHLVTWYLVNSIEWFLILLACFETLLSGLF